MVAILKSAQKGGGGPTYKALTSSLNKMHGDPSGPLDYHIRVSDIRVSLEDRFYSILQLSQSVPN